MRKVNILQISKLLLLLLSSLLAACSTTGQSSSSPTRVTVVGDDSDITSLPRSSIAFQTVGAEINRSLVNEGFSVVDEEAIAADLGFRPTGRRSKLEILEILKLINTSGKASDFTRLAVVYALSTSFRNSAFGGKVSVLIDAELYDLQSNQFLDGFALPRKIFPTRANCDRVCQEDTVRDNAREIASGVGAGLAKKIRSQAQLGEGKRLQNVGLRHSSVHRSSAPGLTNVYTFTFKYFSPITVIEYMRDLESRCDGFLSTDLLYSNPAIKRYSYSSRANHSSIYRCLTLAIDGRGLRSGRDVLLSRSKGDFTVEKVTSVRPIEQPRFN
ncbi:MAG: hypothetical protein HWE12_05995 [Oceanospirillaceae bacterium]|nr:hypothetical protein [Oceanospirillaceae bacterium]